MKVKIISVLLFIVVMFTMFGCNSVDGIEVDSVSIGGISESKNFTYTENKTFYRAKNVGTIFYVSVGFLESTGYGYKLKDYLFTDALEDSTEIQFLQGKIFEGYPVKNHTPEDYKEIVGQLPFSYHEGMNYYYDTNLFVNPNNLNEYAMFYFKDKDTVVIRLLHFEEIKVEYKPLKVDFYKEGFTVNYYIIELKDGKIVKEYKKYEYTGDYSYTNEDNNVKIITK